MRKKEQKKEAPEAELGNLAETVIPFPELPVIDLETKDVEAQAELVRQGAAKAAEWTQTAVAFLGQTRGWSREARELRVTEIRQAEEGLNRLLHEETTPAYRRATWLVVLRHLLSRELGSPEEVKTLFGELIGQGYLVESPDGLLQSGNLRYSVPDEAAFGDPEIQEVAELLSRLSTKVLQAERTERRQQAESLLGQSEMTLREFLGEGEGKFALQIPPEEVPGRDGEPSFWRSGGLLLVESDGEKVWPLMGVGKHSFVRGINEARDLGVHLFIQSLENDRPPYIRTLPEDNRRKVQLLWYLLKRGTSAAKKQEEVLVEETAMASRTTVSPQEFFLEGKPGVCLVRFSGAWHTPENGGTISNLFLLCERRKEEDGSTIVVKEVPRHLTDFLGDFAEEVYQEEESFGGIPYPLGAILKAVFGQTRKAADIAE